MIYIGLLFYPLPKYMTGASGVRGTMNQNRARKISKEFVLYSIDTYTNVLNAVWTSTSSENHNFLV
jgi:hypothetical protein